MYTKVFTFDSPVVLPQLQNGYASCDAVEIPQELAWGMRCMASIDRRGGTLVGKQRLESTREPTMNVRPGPEARLVMPSVSRQSASTTSGSSLLQGCLSATTDFSALTGRWALSLRLTS